MIIQNETNMQGELAKKTGNCTVCYEVLRNLRGSIDF